MSRYASLVARLATVIPRTVRGVVGRGVPAVSVGPGGYAVTGTERRSYPAPPVVSATTEHGSVSVRGEDREEVALTVTKRAHSDADLDRARVVERGGGDDPLELSVEYDQEGTGGPSVAVDLDLAVPESVPVDRVESTDGGVEVVGATCDGRVASSNGSVEVTGVDGSPVLETTNGRVEARDVSGDLVAETHSGSVAVARVGGDATLASTNGSVTAEEVGGFLDARTENGSVEARVHGLDRAESERGGVDVAFDALRGDAAVRSSAGSVTVRAGEGVDAEVTLSATLGSVDAPELDGADAGLVGGERRGVLGDGTHRLDVETRMGSVEFRGREA